MDHTQELNAINSEIQKTKEEHDAAVQELEVAFNEKLIVEYDKYSRFEDRTNQMRKDYEAKLKDLAAQMEAALQQAGEDHMAQLEDKNLVIEEVNVNLMYIYTQNNFFKLVLFNNIYPLSV